MSLDHYTYRISWSQEDGEYVGTCAEFPSLSWLAKDQVEALRGIKQIIGNTIDDLEPNG